jgi:glycerophosphoryl diester phosphodiesterase
MLRLLPLAVLLLALACSTARPGERPGGVDAEPEGILARAVAQGLPPLAALVRDDPWPGDTEPRDLLALQAAEEGQAAAETPLSVLRLRADWAAGTLAWAPAFALADPTRQIPFAITHHFTEARPLTAADFDLRSFGRDVHGGLWFLDVSGPFLLRTDDQGRLLAPPLPLPDPLREGKALRTGRSPVHEAGALQRVVNAVRGHARANGGGVPLVTVDHHLLQDGDEATRLGHREPPGSSELLDVAAFQRAGYRVVPWTVNDPARMAQLVRLGVDGLITDAPHLLHGVLAKERPEVLLPDGRVDRALFDLQAHRGARTVRPENTLPSFEFSLDVLAPTLETDLGLTKDGVAFITHDAVMEAGKCRRADGGPYGTGSEWAVRQHTAGELQEGLVCDRRLAGWPEQRNEVALSPVSSAYAAAIGLPHPYTPLTLAQLLAFPAFYADWYAKGPGKAHPQAKARAHNAGEVWFNLEPKVSPGTGDPTVEGLVRAVTAEVTARRLQRRVIFQCFNWAVLLRVHRLAPVLQTGTLIGDNLGGGHNLRVGSDGNSPWLAGLPFPYRQAPPPAEEAFAAEGGAALGISADGQAVWPLLGGWLQRFDVKGAMPTGERLQLPPAPGEEADPVLDLALYAGGGGLLLEGSLDGAKLTSVRYPGQGQALQRGRVWALPVEATALVRLGPTRVVVAAEGALWMLALEE